jgi:hypothetical protein
LIFTSEGIINLPAYGFLDAMVLKRWQFLADAGVHPVWKEENRKIAVLQPFDQTTDHQI